MIAHDELGVLNNSHELYECHVFGAREAFISSFDRNGGSTRRCTTEGVSRAFRNVQARECVAIGGQEAFVASETNGCLAQDTTSAFRSGAHYDSLAIGGQEAFVRADTRRCLAQDTTRAFSDGTGTHVDSRAVNVHAAFNFVRTVTDCVAEHCRFAFIGIYYTDKRNESRNPRLLGLSFSPFKRLFNRGDRKITGRVIGKNADKLKGKYRRPKND